MESFYIFIVVILFALAISDLIVGVSNDAVNFLNSAFGSKVASIRVIMIVASIGILVGTTFSSGMMEIARKGIMNPDQFFFKEIMIIFISVMLTDIILLDLFNTFGLPTSTTVSIVFELLGASVGIAIIKITNSPEGGDLDTYINTGKALAIIFGILLSVVIAFSFGALIQYLVRVVFSFDYKKYLKYFGSVWGGLAITAITYFMLIKGAKGSSFISPEQMIWIKANSFSIILLSFIGWTLLLQLVLWLFKINVLKFIVLVGTFSLAMAFAGNDLVNFIGVPLAGFESFKTFTAASGADPATFLMDSLTTAVKTPTSLLLIAGIIMAITLWISKKARSVTKTEIDLGRQGEGTERFESSLLARAIVRSTLSFSKYVSIVVPVRIQIAVRKRFDRTSYNKLKSEESISFDLVRASVNLVVASILIAFGTSLKLPLSTTYVTFMVAMGTSLADGAWGRESAVYRISGVITVITGWFFTALSAFTVAFCIAIIIHWTGLPGILILIALAVFLVIRTHAFHNKKVKVEEKEKEEREKIKVLDRKNVLEISRQNVTSTLISVSKLYYLSITGLLNEDRKLLKHNLKDIKKLNQEVKSHKDNVYSTIKLLDEESSDTGPFYVQVLDYLREAAHCLTYLTDPIFNHIDNNHPRLRTVQRNYLNNLNEDISSFFNLVLNTVKKDKFEDLEEIIDKQQSILEQLDKLQKKQVKMIKREEAGTKNSLLFFNTISETKSLFLNTVNIIKSQRDFVIHNKNNSK
ncbi:MAG: inorganic phosphate transporter [Bacteroidetes bacterium]|nr:inorganic phosphate transporter [Bacteroidota bacterium]